MHQVLGAQLQYLLTSPMPHPIINASLNLLNPMRVAVAILACCQPWQSHLAARKAVGRV